MKSSTVLDYIFLVRFNISCFASLEILLSLVILWTYHWIIGRMICLIARYFLSSSLSPTSLSRRS